LSWCQADSAPAAGGADKGKKVRKVFFFEKKKQKTFEYWGACRAGNW
jgi:hypothetical protein